MTYIDTKNYPVGIVIFATAIAVREGALVFNRDMLPGGTDADGKPYFWGIRVTLPGSNGYQHEPYWLGFQAPRGTACSSWGNIPENSVASWVRVESVEEAIRRGPEDYGPSR